MDNNTSNTSKNIYSFIFGFGLGVASGLYYFNTSTSEKPIVIRIRDNNNNIINKEFHLNKINNILYFKEELLMVNIEIILNGQLRHTINKFSGKYIDLTKY